MKIKLSAIILCLFVVLACDVNRTDAQDEEIQELIATESGGEEALNAMLEEIRSMAHSVSCENPSRWRITPYGSKACGGPQGYIAYSSEINVKEFLELVEMHRRTEEAFNIKYGVISDCALIGAPEDVTCIDGKPEFIY